MQQFLAQYHILGLAIGIATFLIIGIFHPIVIKTEYYFGTRPWPVFLIAGILGVVGSIWVNDLFWSALLGVFSFSSFWTIKELFEQSQRVDKGWFPRNPNRS
ncbi:MAG: DUF4491 family protein [Muribaculaceae bacterium]|nr:DUF4491 family protein [Muribaculaceae bacterium]MDE7393108.1 DUF4491 family protein [Muribaculaceae bacterium]